jgi:hypothetical protein
MDDESQWERDRTFRSLTMIGSSFKSSVFAAATSSEYTRNTVFTSAVCTDIYKSTPKQLTGRSSDYISQNKRTFAFRMTLHCGPIQTIRMNFSLCDSLSLEYVTRAYAKDALLSWRTSRSSVRPPVPVCVTVSLSERSVWWVWVREDIVF